MNVNSKRLIHDMLCIIYLSRFVLLRETRSLNNETTNIQGLKVSCLQIGEEFFINHGWSQVTMATFHSQ